ncbi:MAG: TlpA disulfide reductase family protein [Methylomonas sp.]|jgi:DsbE subfamily thiol:disulfide oxidoreductase
MYRRLILTICSLLSVFSLTAQAGEESQNRPVPACQLNNLDNQDHYDMQRFKGKVVYVDFWASWCGPCVESFPYMNKLNNELKDKGLQVIGVNLDENSDDAITFLKTTPAQFLVAADTGAQCAKDFGVKAMPSTYLVDRKGVVREVHYGFRAGEAEEFRGKVEQLLAEPAE